MKRENLPGLKARRIGWTGLIRRPSRSNPPPRPPLLHLPRLPAQPNPSLTGCPGWAPFRQCLHRLSEGPNLCQTGLQGWDPYRQHLPRQRPPRFPAGPYRRLTGCPVWGRLPRLRLPPLLLPQRMFRTGFRIWKEKAQRAQERLRQYSTASPNLTAMLLLTRPAGCPNYRQTLMHPRKNNSARMI